MIKAELILEISKLRANAKVAEEDLKRVGATGKRAAAEMNAGFGLGSLRMFGGGGGGGGGRGLRTDAQEFGRGVNSITGFLGQMTLEASRAAASLGGVLGGAVAGVAQGVSGLALAAGSAGAALSSVVAVDAVRQAAGFARSRLEIERFAGNAEAADQILQEIDDLAIRTPFENASIEETVKGLLTAGVAANRVMEVTRDLAAVAADDETLTRLGGALGVGFANQKFELERVKQFLEAQVNLVPALGNVLGTDSAGVFAAVSQGKVGFDEMTAAIKEMSQEGGQFFGLMEARSRDFNGQMSTLSGNMGMVMRTMGTGAILPLTESLNVINNERMPQLIALAEELSKQFYMAGVAALGFVVAFEEIDFRGLFDGFIAAGLEAAAIVGKSFVDEILHGDEVTKANKKLAAETLKRIADVNQEQRQSEKQDVFSVAGEFGGEMRIYQRTPEGQRQPGESTLDYQSRMLGVAAERGWRSARTQALDQKYMALADEYDRLTTAAEASGPVTRLTRRAGEGLGKSDAIQDFAAQLDTIFSKARALGAAHLRSLPQNESGPEYGPGNAVGIADFQRRQTAAALAAAEAEKPVVEPLMPGAGPEGRYTLAGDLRALVNRMAGRGGDELLYVETQRQTELLGEQAKTLREIKAAMDKPVALPVTAPGTFTQ